MKLKNILIGNGFAAAGSIFWSAVLQFMTVPVLVKYWGVFGYGQWIMLSALPTYLALSDLGLGSAAANDMSMSYAKNKFHEVNKTFHSVLVATLLIALFFIIVAGVICFTGENLFVDKFKKFDSLTFFVLVVYAFVAMLSRILLSTYRAVGKYAIGTAIYDFLQFIEGVSVLLLAFLGYGFLEGAFGLLLGRVVLFLVMLVIMVRVAPNIIFGVSEASFGEIKRLLRPALAALAIPCSLAINNQGILLVAGAIFSPAAAAVISPTRTISRIAIQIVGIVNRATMPEFSIAYAKNNFSVIRKIIGLNVAVMIAVLFPGAIIFFLFGDWFIGVWGSKDIIPESDFLALIAISMFLHGCWYFSSNMLLSINMHTALAPWLVFSAVGSVVASYALSGFGLVGIGWAIFVSEVFILARVAFVMWQKKYILG